MPLKTVTTTKMKTRSSVNQWRKSVMTSRCKWNIRSQQQFILFNHSFNDRPWTKREGGLKSCNSLKPRANYYHFVRRCAQFLNGASTFVFCFFCLPNNLELKSRNFVDVIQITNSSTKFQLERKVKRRRNKLRKKNEQKNLWQRNVFKN